MDDLYTFVYRGVLTDESLDKIGRRRRGSLSAEDIARIREALAFEILDPELVTAARRMAIVYTALHAFENSVRKLVSTALAEAHQEVWWSKVPNKVQLKVKDRMEADARFRWHGARGGVEIQYCDFGDLSSIIVTNWDTFEPALVDMEWAKSLLSVLERARNICMHGGELAIQDIQRIGMNIRDWTRQAG